MTPKVGVSVLVPDNATGVAVGGIVWFAGGALVDVVIVAVRFSADVAISVGTGLGNNTGVCDGVGGTAVGEGRAASVSADIVLA